jgi:hypothetical protein
MPDGKQPYDIAVKDNQNGHRLSRCQEQRNAVANCAKAYSGVGDFFGALDRRGRLGDV